MHRGDYQTTAGRRVMWHVGTKGERPEPHNPALTPELLTLTPPPGDSWCADEQQSKL